MKYQNEIISLIYSIKRCYFFPPIDSNIYDLIDFSCWSKRKEWKPPRIYASNCSRHYSSENTTDKCVTIKRIVPKQSLCFWFETHMRCVCVGMGVRVRVRACAYVWFIFIAFAAVGAFVEHMCVFHIWMIFWKYTNIYQKYIYDRGNFGYRFRSLPNGAHTREAKTIV